MPSLDAANFELVSLLNLLQSVEKSSKASVDPIALVIGENLLSICAKKL
jgi:hypothetical protein